MSQFLSNRRVGWTRRPILSSDKLSLKRSVFSGIRCFLQPRLIGRPTAFRELVANMAEIESLVSGATRFYVRANFYAGQANFPDNPYRHGELELGLAFDFDNDSVTSVLGTLRYFLRAANTYESRNIKRVASRSIK